MVEGEIENIEITYHIEQDSVVGTAMITALEEISEEQRQ